MKLESIKLEFKNKMGIIDGKSIYRNYCIYYILFISILILFQFSLCFNSSLFRFCPFETGDNGPPIPRIEYNSLTPKQFFDQFVSQRRPCILTLSNDSSDSLTDLRVLVNMWTSNEYLKEKAGTQSIDVEVRENHQNFGEGRKTQMVFSDLLDALESNDERYYVTTQRIKEDREGIYLIRSTSL